MNSKPELKDLVPTRKGRKEEPPKLDYWMIEIIDGIMNLALSKLASAYNHRPDIIRKVMNGRNRHEPLGQIQLIKDRLQEIRDFYDEQIKSGLGE